MRENQKELELLNKDPKELIVKYQELITIIVNKFIGSGSINASNRDEFVQVVNERLLFSIDNIKKQYKGLSLVKTYFSTIIRNICLEEINKQKKHKHLDIETIYQYETDNVKLMENTYLNDEFDRLNKILIMYNKKAAKLEFCLKVLYRLKVRITDFTKYCLKFKPNKIKDLIEQVHPTKMIPEFELFEILTPYINKCDRQTNKPDALRRWIKRKIEEIIVLMNGNPPRANYDNETLQILFEKFYTSK